MTIVATCSCGQSYDLTPEHAGQWMQCPQCDSRFQVAASSDTGDPVFGRDTFLLRQKHLAISEKYFVWDEEGRTILYIIRPAHLLRNLAAVAAGTCTLALTMAAGLLVTALIGQHVGEVAAGFVALLTILAAFVAMIAVATLLSKKRHVLFYRDESQEELLLEVKQEQKLVFLNARFTLQDSHGLVLGQFRKNYLYNIFRKRWWFYSPGGALTCVAMEDSILLSLLRRVLGPLFGLLRTNFVILDANERVLGQFNRKMTLLDRYVLDLTRDNSRSLDRRVAVALGVMLDTGERR